MAFQGEGFGFEHEEIAAAVCDRIAYSEVQVFIDRLRFNDSILAEQLQIPEVKDLRQDFQDLADELERVNEELRKEDEDENR